jgi:exosortase/archaeosortase
MKKKDLIHYSGAAGIFILVILLLLYLANNSIPAENKDIIVSIVGMIVGSLSVVIYAIIGRNPDEVADLTTKVESQQKQIETLVEQKDAYEAQMITLQQEIIKAGSDAFKSILDK